MTEKQIKDEQTKEWFVYDTVPQNLRRRAGTLEKRRGYGRDRSPVWELY